MKIYYDRTNTTPAHNARKPIVLCIDRCSLSPEFRIFLFLVSGSNALSKKRSAKEKKL
jgi:hypothetical protein